MKEHEVTTRFLKKLKTTLLPSLKIRHKGNPVSFITAKSIPSRHPSLPGPSSPLKCNRVQTNVPRRETRLRNVSCVSVRARQGFPGKKILNEVLKSWQRKGVREGKEGGGKSRQRGLREGEGKKGSKSKEVGTCLQIASRCIARGKVIRGKGIMRC